jgi:zinc-finger binding domain of transposase IS66/Transposase C of IS166 homeodomain
VFLQLRGLLKFTVPLLALEDVEQGEAGEAEAAEAKSPTARAEGARKRRANRGALPAHLPRVETLVDVEDKTCPCCKGALHRIGEDVSERLDAVRAQVFAHRVPRQLRATRYLPDRAMIPISPAP